MQFSEQHLSFPVLANKLQYFNLKFSVFHVLLIKLNEKGSKTYCVHPGLTMYT